MQTTGKMAALLLDMGDRVATSTTRLMPSSTKVFSKDFIDYRNKLEDEKPTALSMELPF